MKIEGENTIFEKAIGTPCEICVLNPQPSWVLKSDRLVHDRKTKKLHFYNTWLEIFGVPIIYTPYLQTHSPDPTSFRIGLSYRQIIYSTPVSTRLVFAHVIQLSTPNGTHFCRGVFLRNCQASFGRDFTRNCGQHAWVSCLSARAAQSNNCSFMVFYQNDVSKQRDQRFQSFPEQ